MFKALDHVSYDTLRLNKPSANPDTGPWKVKPLVDLSCYALNACPSALGEGIHVMPAHLAPKLLQTAVRKSQNHALGTIIANWPLDELRFIDILSEDERAIFEEDSGCDFCIFVGVSTRTKYCKMKLLDFRGLILNELFIKLIVKIWPLLSLKKSQLKPKKLAKLIGQKAAGVESGPLVERVIPKVLEDSLANLLIRDPETRQILARRPGYKLEVKLDGVSFSNSSTFFIDYLICNCLRSISSIHITVTNIHIKTELMEGDSIQNSLAPFIVLKGQDTQTLEGLSLRELEEGVFLAITPDVKKFTKLRNLDIQDCNIYLQEGITRSRTSARMCLSNTLGAFDHLHRLDISFNYLLGCLGELLDALKCPLEFLSLKGCDVNETDLEMLSRSKHSAHLRELNMSKLCQLSIYEDRISPVFLLRILRKFPMLSILNMSQNHIPDTSIPEFCKTITEHLTELKGLDIAGNILQLQHQMSIARSCAKLPSMQRLRLTCVNNMGPLNDAILPQNDHDFAGLWTKFRELLDSLGRNDIYVDVVKLSFHILLDLIDI